MASIIKVDTIKDTSDNTLLTSSSGNVSISNNLIVDTNTLYVDSANNQVGIGTTSPANKLEVSGAIVSRGAVNSYTNDGLYLSNEGSSIFKIGAWRSGASASILTFGTDSGSDAAPVERMRIDSSGNVGIGTTSPSTALHVSKGSSGGTASANAGIIIEDNSNTYLNLLSPNTFNNGVYFGDEDDNDVGYINYAHGSDSMAFGVDAAEAMRIDSSQQLLVGKTSSSGSVAGAVLGPGYLTVTRSAATPLSVNRLTNDGTLIRFEQANILEGSIEVSGANVTLAGFTGSHWSRLSDNSKPTILKGTILESLDEMMDWYQVQFDITDEEGNTTTQKQSYALADGQSVGDVITYNYEGTDYQATIIQEADVKHTKSKISDTVDAKNVYGVFFDWDNSDDTVNDMYVAQTGSYVIRINGSETVSKGDLIQSNGDGTGKVQSDDIIRASTVAKVISSIKIETYDDGSYIVPCTLHC